jgi:hypothetical protein
MWSPVNITAQWVRTGSGINISWHPPSIYLVPPSSAPSCHYVVEYRTVGRWALLSDRLNVTSFVWKTASHGATYQFRVHTSEDGTTSVHNSPSAVVTFETGDPMREGGGVSNGAVGVIIACLVVGPIVAFFIVIIARFYRRKKRRELRLIEQSTVATKP